MTKDGRTLKYMEPMNTSGSQNTSLAPLFTSKRVSLHSTGVYSVFEHKGEPFALICERAATLMPPGVWKCVKSFYHKGNYPTYEILIPGHERVLFHKGNVPENSDGCQVVAEKFGILKGRTAVLESQEGFDEFMNRAKGVDSFYFEIVEMVRAK